MSTPEASAGDLAEQAAGTEAPAPGLPDEAPLEADPADAAEQSAPATAVPAAGPADLPLEADPADAAEQAVVVEDDEDEHR